MLKEMHRGILAEDIKPGSNIAKIFSQEIHTLYTGEISVKDENEESATANTDSGPRGAKATKDIIIEARWKVSGNRVTAPLCKRGESVRIFRDGNTDQYYWEEWEQQSSLRKEDIALFIFGSDKKEFKEVDDKKNATWIKVDTLNHQIQIHTSEKEVVHYDVTIDFGKGKFQLVDSKGNYQKLDTNAGVWDIHGNSAINLSAKTITFKADSIISTCKNFTITTTNYILKGVNAVYDIITNFKKKMNCNNNAKISNFKSGSKHSGTIE